MRYQRNRRIAHAFTLVEILMVISIISLLAAIIFPVFSSAKKAAQGSKCISNLSQLGDAILLYREDHDDYFPYALDGITYAEPPANNQTEKDFFHSLPILSDVIALYTKTPDLWHCPSDDGANIPSGQRPCKTTCFAEYRTSYYYIYRLGLEHASDPVVGHYPSVGPYPGRTFQASQIPMLFDISLWHPQNSGGDAVNAVFVDGHAKRHNSSEVAFGLIFDDNALY